ncbi:MAG: amidohydrolase family protein [Burkholderiales bacterium]|nr:amidohydrolase family protein [Burkholderiales bacterium]
MPRVLIKNACILSLDPQIGDLDHGDLLVTDERITEVAPRIEAQADRVIDGAGTIVLPGLINAHVHTWETALRGIGSDWAGSDYFNFFHAKLAPLYTPQDTFIGTLVGSLAQIDAGVTAIFDWCHNNSTPAHTDAAVDALFESGVRAVFGHGTVKPHPKPGQLHFSQIPHPVAEISRLRKGRLSSDDALVKLSMAILGPDYSTLEVCRQDFRAARDFGLLSSAHVWGRANRLVPGGYRTIAAEGLLDENHNAVHANYIEDDELKVLIDCGASITSTTTGEMNNHVRPSLSGRIRKLQGHPSIGTDSEVATKGDMFEAMRSALRIQRLFANQETVLKLEQAKGSAAAEFARNNLKTIGTGGSFIEKVSFRTREILEWATINNAKAMRIDHLVGSLTPGKQADIIMVRRDGLHIVSAQDPVQAVVSYAQNSDVDTVMIAGRIVKEQGVLTFGGLHKRIDELRQSAARLLAQERANSAH